MTEFCPLQVMCKKRGFFLVADWKKSLIAIILYALLIAGLQAGGLNRQTAEPAAVTVKMTAKVKMKEAATLDQLSLLRLELSQLRQKKLLLERDGKTLAGEKTQLKEKLIDILKRYREQNRDWERLQLSVVATLAKAKVKVVGKREDQLLGKLKSVTANGQAFAMKTIEFCDYVEALLSKMPLGAMEKAKIKLYSDGLRSDAGRLCAISAAVNKAQTVERCRLLEVNDQLQVVVLPVGWVHGVRNGLIFYTGKNDSCKLQVIAARPFIAAAIVKEGNIKELAPGMVASVNRKIIE